MEAEQIRDLFSCGKPTCPCDKPGLAKNTHCPAHVDNNPSLHVGKGHDGRTLIKCFAGCSIHSILRASSLIFRDLYPGSGNES